MISRANGPSAVASAAYWAASRLEDERLCRANQETLATCEAAATAKKAERYAVSVSAE